MTWSVLNSLCVGMTASYRKIRTDKQFPQTEGTLYAQKGVMDGSSPLPIRSYLKNEAAGPESLLQCSPLPHNRAEKKKKVNIYTKNIKKHI